MFFFIVLAPCLQFTGFIIGEISGMVGHIDISNSISTNERHIPMISKK